MSGTCDHNLPVELDQTAYLYALCKHTVCRTSSFTHGNCLPSPLTNGLLHMCLLLTVLVHSINGHCTFACRYLSLDTRYPWELEQFYVANLNSNSTNPQPSTAPLAAYLEGAPSTVNSTSSTIPRYFYNAARLAGAPYGTGAAGALLSGASSLVPSIAPPRGPDLSITGGSINVKLANARVHALEVHTRGGDIDLGFARCVGICRLHRDS